MASILKVNEIETEEIRDANGNVLISSSTSIIRSGEVIEMLSSVCNGSNVTVSSGTYSFQNVTTQQASTDAYADVTGSSITYTPPADATRVIYRFEMSLYSVTTHDIGHWKFFIDSDEVVAARTTYAAQYIGGRYVFTWPIEIGNGDETYYGRVNTWTSGKTLKMQMRRYGGSNYYNIHGSRYWDGTTGNQLSLPVLSIIAIA